MAVQLCKSDGTLLQSLPPPDVRNYPRVRIRNEPPLLAPSHQGKKISARSDSHYACGEPEREEVWRENYGRRSFQLNHCGFHGVAHQPYQDVGPVILDDRRLVLEGLGHSNKPEQHEGPKTSPKATQQQHIHHHHHVAMASPYRVKLRAKTPSQFPTELANLDSKLVNVDTQLDLIRKGRGLFQLMKESEMEKQETDEQRTLQEEQAQREEWREPDAISETSLFSDSEGSSLNLVSEESETKLQQSQAKRESCDVQQAKDAELLDDLTSDQESEKASTTTEGGFHSPDSSINKWYRRLCVLVWVLRSMQVESPDFMDIPFSKCWSLDHPVPDEGRGRRLAERRKKVQQQYENNINKPYRLARAQSRGKGGRQVTDLEVLMSRALPALNGVEEKRDEMMEPNAFLIHSDETTTKKKHSANSYRTPSRMEEERMRRQKKLTPMQMQNLMTLLEEHLNYSKKQSRSQMNAILREADKARQEGTQDVVQKKKQMWQLPPISLNVGSVKKQFSEAEEGRRMVVHEQLTAMERDRKQAVHQRFGSLQVSGNMWEDLATMREGVHIETTSMARKRLLMNYEWYPQLLERIPPPVKAHPYCKHLLLILSELAGYMREVGPGKMSRRRLIQVLSTLRPFELQSPDVADAVEFLIQNVIYVVAEDYEKWLEQHHLSYQAKLSAKSGAA